MKRYLLLLSLLLLLPAFYPGRGANTARAQAPIRSGALLREARQHLHDGRYAGAVELADSVRRNTINDLTRIEAIDVLAKGYTELVQINHASEVYREGMEVFAHSPRLGAPDSLVYNPDYSRFLFNYAQFLLNTGDYDGTLDLLADVRFPADTDERARLGGLQAAALMRKGDLSTAREILDYEINGNSGSATATTLLQNRGYLHLLAQDYLKATSDLETAVNRLGGKNKEIARANLAMAYSGLGHYDKALQTIDKAISSLKRISGTGDMDYIIALRKKGEILHKAGRKKEALETFRQFYGLETERMASVLPSLTPAMRLNYWTMEKPLLSQCFLVGTEDPGFALDVALMRRQTSLLARRNDGDDGLPTGGPEDVRKALGTGDAAVAFISYPDGSGLTQYAALTLDPKGNSSFVSLFDEDYIYAPYADGRSLYDLMVSEDPRDKNVLYTDSLLGEKVWKKVLEALPADTRNVSFAPEGVFHLWGIENMPFDGKEHYNLIRRFSLLDLPATTPSGKTAGTEASLFAGGLDYDDTSAPEATPGETGDERHPLNREAYTELTRNFGMRGGIFQFLPGTALEVEECVQFVPQAHKVDFLTEEDLKATANQYRRLHLATHGYALDCGLTESGLPTDSLGFDLTLLRSGLALSGANSLGKNTDREDGILSAREICDLDLRGVDLVVLSACQTAKGVISDESASGLIRALKIAGAGTIVASLWEVDDRSAALFMSNFYRALGEGMDRQEAFNAARERTATHLVSRRKRKFDAASMAGRTTGETVESRPFSAPWYWAPFIMIDP